MRRQASCGVTSVSRQYVNTGAGVRCGSQSAPHASNTGYRPAAVPAQRRQAVPQVQPRTATVPQGLATGGTIASTTRIVPRHVAVNRQNTHNLPVPKGYRRVWEDDRLNPTRAEQTVAGALRTNYLWTNTVPRRLINANTREDVSAKVPLIYPYVDMATQQRELGAVTIVRREGQTLKRILRNANSNRQPFVRQRTARQAIVRQPVVSSRSAPVTKPKAAARTQPAATTAGRYVQVGTFGQPANAQATAQRIKSLGLPVRLGRFTRGGKTYQLVLAGPFGADAPRALARVRGAGFGDAFLRK